MIIPIAVSFVAGAAITLLAVNLEIPKCDAQELATLSEALRIIDSILLVGK